MEFRKALFFEIPNREFIMPVYTEADVNTLKSFLDSSLVQFSVGYKSEEDKNGYYYIGQVKELTDVFLLKDFPLVYRKRVIDILKGLREDPQSLNLHVEEKIIKKLVYFVMTKNGIVPHVLDFSHDNIERLEHQEIEDYFIKEFSVLAVEKHRVESTYSAEEIFYKIKNPNY